MFVPFWVIFMASGLAMAVGAVVWGIRSHQFDEQDRARYLPLAGLSERELTRAAAPLRLRDQLGMMAMFTVGLGAIGAGLMYALRWV